MLRSSSLKIPEFKGDEVELRDRDASALLPQRHIDHDDAVARAEDQTAAAPVDDDVTPPPFESFKMPVGEQLTPEELL